MNAIPNDQAHESEPDLMSHFVELIKSGDIVPVLRPDNQVGWMPAPIEYAADVRICQLCGGTGFLSDAIASLVTADFRLENMCPACHGTGVLDEVNEAAPTEPLPSDGEWVPF